MRYLKESLNILFWASSLSLFEKNPKGKVKQMEKQNINQIVKQIEKQVEKQNLPEKKFSTGSIQVTVWKNQVKAKDGKDHEYRTFSFLRRYRDQAGEWKSSCTLRINDLPKAVVALSKAYEFAVLSTRTSDEDIVI